MSVDSIADDVINVADEHLLHFIKADHVLTVVEG